MVNAKGKGIVDEVDNLEEIKKDEWELEKEVEENKGKKLKKEKEIEDSIEEEFTVFDYDDA